MPVAAVAEILGVDRQQFYEWKKLGLLGSREVRSRLTRADAVELAVLAELSRRIGGVKARIAYKQLRASVIVADPESIGEIVWVDQDRTALLVNPADDIRKLIRHPRPVLLIEVGAEIQRVLEAFQRDLSGRQGQV